MKGVEKMLIKELEMKEFRGVKSCLQPIKLSNFNALVGRNNSGKSTVLEALYLLPNPRVESVIPKIKPRISYLQQNYGIGNLVYLYSGRAELKYNGGDIKIGLNEKGGMDSFEMNGRDFETKRESPDAGIEKSRKYFGIKRGVGEKFSALIPNSTEFIDKLDKSIEDYQNKIMKSGAERSVATKISECVSDNYTEVITDTLKLRKELPDGNAVRIKLSDLGAGAKKAVKLMLLLNVIKPKLVLWDDFETSAHPGMIKILLEWLSKGDWQVVLSTHSIDVLEKLLEIKPHDLNILNVTKSRDDILSYKTLDIYGLEDLLGINQDPRLITDALKI